MKRHKNFLTVNKSGINGLFFIMNNRVDCCGQVSGTPYFKTMKDATVFMFNVDNSDNTNIYDMSQKEYDSWLNCKED